MIYYEFFIVTLSIGSAALLYRTLQALFLDGIVWYECETNVSHNGKLCTKLTLLCGVDLDSHQQYCNPMRRAQNSMLKLLLNIYQTWVETGPWFNIKMPFNQFRKSHCGDKTVVRTSYLHNGISYTGKMTSLYWIRAQVAFKTYIYKYNLT